MARPVNGLILSRATRAFDTGIMAHRTGIKRTACQACENESTDIHRLPLFVEGRALDAWIEYRKCPNCQQVERSSIVLTVDDGTNISEEGVFNSVSVPLTPQAWDTEKGSRIWELLHPDAGGSLTSAEIEEKYSLKPGSVRQAFRRGAIPAAKRGHDLLITALDAERQWGHRVAPKKRAWRAGRWP